MPQPLVSVVVMTWNRRDDVRNMLQELEKTTCPSLEVIVVDNGSTDGTVEMLHSDFPEVICVALSENVGIEARNIGFKRAAGKYIVGLDDDSYPASDTIEKMVTLFEKNHDLAILAFRIIIPSTGQIVTQKWSPQPRFFWGCGFGIRADVLKEAGYYSGDFFIYANEEDLSIRVKELGYDINYVSDLTAYHAKAPSYRSRNSIYFGTRNRIWFMRKYMTGYYKYLGICRVLTLFWFYALGGPFLKPFFKGIRDGLIQPVSELQNQKNVSKATQRWFVEGHPIFEPLRAKVWRKVRSGES